MTVRCGRRTFLRIATGTMGLDSLPGCVGTFGTEPGEPVRFGAMLPVSGSLEQVGTHGKRVARQAIEDINGVSDVPGRSVELTTMDVEGSTSAATDGYALLADAGVVGFVGGLVSDVSLALAPKAADDAVTEMSPVSTNPWPSDARRVGGREFSGRTVLNDNLQATVMTKIFDVPQYADADRVALLTVDGAFGSDLGTVFGDQFDAEVITKVSYDPSAEAFGGVTDEVFTSSSDAVGFASVSGQERGVLDAYGASDHGAPWIFSMSLFDDEIPPYYERLYSVPLSSVRTDGYFHLTQRLSDIAPFQPYAADAYDALFLTATAAKHADEVSGPTIADTLQTVSGGTGHTVSVGEFGRARTLVDADHELNYQDASSGVDLTEAPKPLSSYLIERVRSGSVGRVELLQHRFFESGGGR